MTPARLRPLAEADLVEPSLYYAAEAGEEVAERFFGAAIGALRAVERMPGSGTPRIGEHCDIAGLRMRRVEGFPCGWFYFVRPDHVDVVVWPTPRTSPPSSKSSTTSNSRRLRTVRRPRCRRGSRTGVSHHRGWPAPPGIGGPWSWPTPRPQEGRFSDQL